MTKKTLLTSLSLAAAALTLATVPGPSVSAHDLGDFETLLNTPTETLAEIANKQASEEDDVLLAPEKGEVLPKFEAPAVTPKPEDNTDKKAEVTAPAPKVEESNPDLFGGRDLNALLDAPMSEIEKEANDQATEEDDVLLAPEKGEVLPKFEEPSNVDVKDKPSDSSFADWNLDALLDAPMSEIEKEATAQAVEEDDVELKAEDVLVSDKPVVEANPNLFGGRDLDALLDTPMSEIEKEATAQAMEEDDVVLKPEDFLHVATTSKNPPVVVLPTYPLTAAPSVGSAKEDNVPTSTVVTTAKQDKSAVADSKPASTPAAAVVEAKQEAKKELPRTGDATWASMMAALAGMGLVAAAGTLRKRYSN